MTDTPPQSMNVAPQAKVLVIVPTTRDINVHVVTWLFEQASRSKGQVAVMPFLHKRGGSFVEDARQSLVDTFLASNVEWLFQLDADTIPRFNVLDALFRAESIEAKLVCYPTPFIGPYPGVASNIFISTADPEDPGNIVLGGVAWHDLPWDQKDENGHRAMFEIDSAGFGCTLIHRSVLVDLMEKARSRELTDYPMRAIWKEGKVYYGEDQAFFLRVKGALGLKVYADLECICNHYKPVLMNPNLARDYYGGTAPSNPDAPYDDTRYEGLKTGKPLYDAAGSVLKVLEGGK